jgi:histidinol phosphatase-like enzyme
LDAVKDFDIDLDKSYAIGDRITDCSICDYSGCKGCLISNETVVKSDTVKVFKNLGQCADYIVGD